MTEYTVTRSGAHWTVEPEPPTLAEWFAIVRACQEEEREQDDDQ